MNSEGQPTALLQFDHRGKLINIFPGVRSDEQLEIIRKALQPLTSGEETNLCSLNYEQLAQAINKSKYQMVAVGWRDVGIKELEHVLEVIIESKPGDITTKLNRLYEQHPDTIALDEALARRGQTVRKNRKMAKRVKNGQSPM